MRILLAIFSLLLVTSVRAEIGKVVKVVGHDSYLTRGGNKINLTVDSPLEIGDEIYSQTSFVVLYIYPGTQMSMGNNGHVKLAEHELTELQDMQRSYSLINLVKGMLRLSITKEGNEDLEQRVQTESASFGVRGTEFEIALEDNKSVDLDVFEGIVEVSSPYVQSFVPEIVKANEGLRFEFKKKGFVKRKFAPKFRNHPGFSDAKVLRSKWMEIRAKKKPFKNLRKRIKKKGSRTKSP